MPEVHIPAELLPADGRFGSGPSKVRQEAVDRLAAAAPTLLGTSHRQRPVKELVGRIRSGLRTLFALPDDFEIALGVGGATLFWDIAAFGLILEQSAHAVHGEFGGKFASAVALAPFLKDPVRVEAPFGSAPTLEPVPGVDAYAYPQNETSTGVALPLTRPAGDGLVLVDATSAAGAMPFDAEQVDAYFFSPQKAFASEGGLWIALLSPAALTRLGAIRAQGRPVPPSLDLSIALDNAGKDQTYNTPSITTLFLLADSVEWLLEQGGLDWSVASCRAKSDHLYAWAEAREWASPYVADPALRSPVVATIDLDADVVAAADVTAVLRAHGVVDIDAYRKLGRNQLRIAVFPAVDRADVEQLTACIDHVVEQLAAG